MVASRAHMSKANYRHNHYVPQWYQHRFFPSASCERKFSYLDLTPDSFVDVTGTTRTKTALRRWGPPSCFAEDDLYTTRFGSWQSTEIEEQFFGRIDTEGRKAVDYFANFEHPSADTQAFHAMITYMSTQKLRTPKGLAYLSLLTDTADHNAVLFAMQELQNLHGAMWTEAVWSIADASLSRTKFIISDHPVTVYNSDCFPLSAWCRDGRDPDVWLEGTHTLFPLCYDKILILTNLSWVRNPYGKATRPRPNPNPMRPAMFYFNAIQTGRRLTEVEVNEINFIIKRRALRYIAAAREDWLYPELRIPTEHWRHLGNGYLLMPDPRSVTFSREIMIGYDNKRSDAFDEYGRKPWQEGYGDDARADREWKSFHRFQGEFARLFGAKRRGRCFEFHRLGPEEDDPKTHANHLSLEKEFGPGNRRGADEPDCLTVILRQKRGTERGTEKSGTVLIGRARRANSAWYESHPIRQPSSHSKPHVGDLRCSTNVSQNRERSRTPEASLIHNSP